ncbi:hypothetical protein [Nonomuraea sp. NPDC049646]|uniref:hypothetical protein n=1 Tax=unclassified Nonomuraea TaxID=2593643 RepID=UPI0037BC4F88
MQWLNVGQVAIQPRKNGPKWFAYLTCPAPLCGAKATVSNNTQFGTYEGVCSEDHELRIPHLR